MMKRFSAGRQVLSDLRVVQLNVRPPADGPTFRGNAIQTTKYTWLTFLPKGLHEQFRRVANLYFLVVAILSCTPISPVNPLTNVMPLVLVISLSLAKEAFEDSKRRKKDKEVNDSIVDVILGKRILPLKWKDIRVGDIVKVRDKGSIPADLIILSSTNPGGVCYVETMNLDGETNLKHKQACEATMTADTDERVSHLMCTIESEHPNESLYTFTGNLHNTRLTYPLTPNNVLLRGCILRNTQHVYGAVIFAGHETKVMMNSTAVPSKRSRLERRLDLLIAAIFAMQFAICLVGAIGSAVWVDSSHWYLNLGSEHEPSSSRALFDPSNRGLVAVLTFMTLVTLYSSIIPISLYVSIEIIKYSQAVFFINQDVDMYDEATGTPASARTSNLNEELGQVQHIFSDKTGTLTCNRMEFFKCSIAGVSYGEGASDIQNLLSNKPDSAGHSKSERKEGIEGCAFYDKRIFNGNFRREKDAEVISEFFRLLAICHTVIPEERTENGIKDIHFQAASPDEAALVAAARAFGYFFCKRELDTISIMEELDGTTSQRQYRILAMLEFNSFRKRQSVIIEMPDGNVRLYCKGADNVIFERLSEDGKMFVNETKEHLLEFGNDGLRTLCLAYRDIPRAEFDSWATSFYQARISQEDRDSKVDQTSELIERNLILLGCTAIEDKLQDKVPQSISSLMQAGIKLWVLTGDKVETAVNIGYACNLLHAEQQIFTVTSVDEHGENRVKEEMMSHITKSLGDAVANARSFVGKPEEAAMALVMDGKVLETVLASEELKSLMLEAGQMSQSVICCRVSPLQKALVAKMVKESTGKITLAIGDGANDVGMIQSADVGVGISGQEGRQAVMSSDFAIAQFHFLVKLLLVHGQWSYRRLARVILYFFYKNITYTLTQFWFNIYAAYSGQRFYDDWYQSLYNIAFTSIPVMVMGLVDQDISAKNCLRIPQLYQAGQRGDLFNRRTFVRWLASSIWQSLVCFYVPVWALAFGAVNSSGHTVGQWAVGTVSCCVAIITVNLRLLLESSYHTWITYASVIGSILLWFGYVVVYCTIWPAGMGDSMDNMNNIYKIIYEISSLPGFWLSLVLAPVTSLLPDVVAVVIMRYCCPTDHDIIQEYEQGSVEEDAGGLEKLLLPAYRRSVSTKQTVSFANAQHSDSAKGEGSRKLNRRQTGFAFEDPCHEGYHAEVALGIRRPSNVTTLTRHVALRKSLSDNKCHGKVSVTVSDVDQVPPYGRH